MFADLALIAVVTEAMVGYPDAVYRLVGHPVAWIGRLIAWCDETWNSEALSFDVRRQRGVFALLLLLAVAIASGVAITAILTHFFPALLALLLVGVLASSLLAQRSLAKHVADVAIALERDGIEAGRQAVAQIVGRDTKELDEAAVCRAAIESLAENFSDGVVAPLFWMVFAGLPGALAYKAINTADSMIGHKSPRHLAFGGRRPARRPGEPARVATLGAGWCWRRRSSACRRAAGWRRCGATPATIARPTPAGRKPPWPARSASVCPARESIMAWRSRSAGSAREAASLARATSGQR
jgi:hypothetical protein